MPLVSKRCPECGGELMVDEKKKEAVCQYCGTSFMISNPEVHVHNGQSMEEKLNSAETFLTVHQDFEKAYAIFKQIANEFPNDYRGWWGMARAATHEFQDVDHLGESESNVRHAQNVAPEAVRIEINETWQEYQRRCKEMAERVLERQLKEERLEWEQRIERQNENEQLEQKFQKEYDSLLSESGRLSDLSNRLHIGSKILLIIGIVLIIPPLCLQTDSFAGSSVVSVICIVISILLFIQRNKSDREWKIIDEKLKRMKEKK